ncbi:MAG: MtrAB system histidine kinase MtrB, partial [Sciscionella sp.]
NRLLSAKQQAATAQIGFALSTIESAVDSVSVTASADVLSSQLANVLSKLISTSPQDQGSGSSAAGPYQAVLASALTPNDDQAPASGNYAAIPQGLRQLVREGNRATQIATANTAQGRITFVMVGASVVNAPRPLQLYLLFPLTSERNTVGIVQGTLELGGLVLVLLLAGIAYLVTRQVVRPVREAAGIAERFANGHLDERMRVVGEDEVARLAEAYNGMAQSITEQIRKLEEFGGLQRRFTSDVSHELRTPLTTVRMAADVLHASREAFPAGLSRSSELLVDELDRFESLLGDLLEISRLDAGVEELTVEVADLCNLAQAAAESVRGIAGSAGTTIALDPGAAAASAEVDTRRVERILRNLLANAIDHGEGRPVVILVGANENAVAVCVRDYGVGLRPGEAELVFNRFWRADPSRNRRTGGTGLGLAISVEDARLHGGRLEAWGEPGNGAAFRLTLPRVHGGEITEPPLPLPPVDAGPVVEVDTGPRDNEHRPAGEQCGPPQAEAAAASSAGWTQADGRAEYEDGVGDRDSADPRAEATGVEKGPTGPVGEASSGRRLR